MQERLLRAIYGIEFLMALVAALLFWNYVGGATHLEYVPWFWKGLLSLGVAGAVVRITAASSLRAAAKWIGLLVLLVVGCGLLSYSAHITEPQDEGDEGDQGVVPTRQTMLLNRHYAIPVQSQSHNNGLGFHQSTSKMSSSTIPYTRSTSMG